jgi:hypothetical protein
LKGKKMKHAQEGGHWYTREGEPAYTTKSAKGDDRPTTLRDARKLNLVPSVTTILGVAAKPGLEIWKQNQVLLAALTLPRQEGEAEADWVNRIIQDSKEQGRQAAEFGTAIHAEIQAHFEGRSYAPEFKDYVEGAVAAISSQFNDWEWISEKSFAHELGYGGKCDLFIPADDKHGFAGFVADIKTKDFGPDDEVSAFDEHLLQLAAYRVGLGAQRARCANVFVSRNHPGLVQVIEWDQEDLDRGWQMFLRLLEFWQIKNNHK